MNSFVNAIGNADVANPVFTHTENGDLTYATSRSYMVDAFFRIGASRKDVANFLALAEKAYVSNPELFARLVLHGRDIRSGIGERDLTRQLLQNFYKRMVDAKVIDSKLFLAKFVEMGRWDDLLNSGEDVFAASLSLIKKALDAKDGLCAKWLPRKGFQAVRIRKYLGLSPKDYRKTLVELTNVVETQMCAKEWDQINYNHVPSIASKVYQKAFHRNDGDRYRQWIEDLSKPESGAKVNAGAIFPHDVLKGHIDAVVDAQWKALPDFIQNGESFLPMCDVSGSMYGLPMEVCVALGLYCAERNKSAFKDIVITFSSNPQMIKLKGNTILERQRFLMSVEWGMSTDIDKAFKMVLDHCVKNNVASEDLPKSLIIFSDMQFNAAVSGGIAYDRWRKSFADAGYELPRIVFWNLRASAGSPVEFDKEGTALVSGFSPSNFLNLLGGKTNPYDIMLDTLNNSRYDHR